MILAGRGPVPVGNIIAEAIGRLGVGQHRAALAKQQAWRQAVGEEFADSTRIGAIRKGILEVIVSNSTLMQELNYDKAEILEKLAVSMPELNVADLRFRIGPVG